MKFQDTNQQPPTLLEQLARRRRVKLHYSGLNASYYRQETNAAARYTYTFDKLRRLAQEVKRGTGQGTPLHYQKDFSYDKAGNRLSYQHQNGGGYNYGLAVNYNLYIYDAMGRLTQIRDSGRSFTATVTNDWNGNITQVSESWGGIPTVSTFAYDYENRLTEFTIGGSGFSAEHTYDRFNRLVKTDATVGQATTNYEHVYAGKKHLGNIDVTGTPVNGKVWRWEGGAGAVDNAPIEAPQRSTASATQFYALNDERNMQRKSYRVATVTAGDYNDDSRYAEWQQVNGSVVPTRVALTPNPSELFSAYAISLDADRASSAATNHALQLAATDLEYEVTRVKSPVLGRDLNPMGRGDGTYYCNGGNYNGASIAMTGAKPSLYGWAGGGYGTSTNNQGAGGGGGGPAGPTDPRCHQPACCYGAECLSSWLAPVGSERSCCPQGWDFEDGYWPNKQAAFDRAFCNDYEHRLCVCANFDPPYWPPWWVLGPCYPSALDFIKLCVCPCTIESCWGVLGEECGCEHLWPPKGKLEDLYDDDTKMCARKLGIVIKLPPDRGWPQSESGLTDFQKQCRSLCMCRWLLSDDVFSELKKSALEKIIDCIKNYHTPTSIALCIGKVLLEEGVEVPGKVLVQLASLYLSKSKECLCQANAIYACNQFFFGGGESR